MPFEVLHGALMWELANAAHSYVFAPSDHDLEQIERLMVQHLADAGYRVSSPVEEWPRFQMELPA